MNVVWIHGFGEDSSIWEDFTENIHSYFSPYFFDHSDKTDYSSIKEYAEDLRSFIEANHIENPVLIGHSMGGYIALEYVSLYPETFSGLGLFHSSAAEDPDTKKAERKKTIEFISKHGTATFIRSFYPNMFTESFKNENYDLIQENIRHSEKLKPEALISATLSMLNRNDHLETLSNLKVPVFQILGKQDTFIPLKKALEQTMLLQMPNCLVLNQVAHAGMLESPEICADFINNFLSEI